MAEFAGAGLPGGGQAASASTAQGQRHLHQRFPGPTSRIAASALEQTGCRQRNGSGGTRTIAECRPRPACLAPHAGGRLACVRPLSHLLGGRSAPTGRTTAERFGASRLSAPQRIERRPGWPDAAKASRPGPAPSAGNWPAAGDGAAGPRNPQWPLPHRPLPHPPDKHRAAAREPCRCLRRPPAGWARLARRPAGRQNGARRRALAIPPRAPASSRVGGDDGGIARPKLCATMRPGSGDGARPDGLKPAGRA